LKQIGQRNIWLDLSNDSETIPANNNAVILKVSRILEPRSNPVASSASPTSTAVPAPAPALPPRPRNEEPPKPKPAPVPAPVVEEGLLDFDDIPATKPSVPVKSAPVAAPAPAFDDDLLGINSAPAPAPAAKSSSQADPVSFNDPTCLAGDILTIFFNLQFAADPFGLSTLQPTVGASSGFPPSPSTNPILSSAGSSRMQSSMDPFSGMSSNPMVGNPMGGGRGMPSQQQGMGMNQNRGAGFDPFSNLGSTGNSNQYNSNRRY
jgi:hypothetical protein